MLKKSASNSKASPSVPTFSPAVIVDAVSPSSPLQRPMPVRYPPRYPPTALERVNCNTVDTFKKYVSIALESETDVNS